MAINSEDRKELECLLETIYKNSKRAIIEEIMPASITLNGEKTGITIEFRKFHSKRVAGITIGSGTGSIEEE